MCFFCQSTAQLISEKKKFYNVFHVTSASHGLKVWECIWRRSWWNYWELLFIAMMHMSNKIKLCLWHILGCYLKRIISEGTLNKNKCNAMEGLSGVDFIVIHRVVLCGKWSLIGKGTISCLPKTHLTEVCWCNLAFSWISNSTILPCDWVVITSYR